MMRPDIHRVFFLLLLAGLCGCTTMKEVRTRDVSLADHLEMGDRIVVYEKSGRIVTMRYVRVDGTVLRGSLADDGLEPVEIFLDGIERIESERVAVWRTAGAVLGGIVLAPIAAVGAGLALAGQ